jgi:hypothetical protein
MLKLNITEIQLFCHYLDSLAGAQGCTKYAVTYEAVTPTIITNKQETKNQNKNSVPKT